MDPKKSKKKPELLDQLQVGNYIDAYHVGGKQYRLAYILSRNDKEIEVTYDGLSKKDNETFKLQSNKVYFARRFTNNYTGEDYRGGRTSREYLKFTNEECMKRIKELKDIQSSNFQGLSAIEICQMLRVRHFIWLDMVLSIELIPIHLAVALDYIKQFFTFLVWYYKQFPLYYGDYIRSQQNQELYLYDERASIAACFGELTECFCMLFGSIWRVLKPENSYLYINYDSLSVLLAKQFPVVIYHGFTVNPNIADWKLYNGAHDIVKCIRKTWPLYLQLMSYFRSIDGLAAWEGLLKPVDGEYNYLPLKAMSKYALANQYLSQYYSQAEQANISKKLLEWLYMRVQNLSVAEIKDTEIDAVKDAVTEMDYLFTKGFTQEQLNKWTDEIQLQLAIKFLKSPYLEKRVKGISEIKEFTERVKQDVIAQFKPKITIPKEDLVKWIRDQRILDLTMLGDSVHPELIKRSHEIAIFLCKNNSFYIDMIDRIWLQNQDKHETTLLALYEFFKTVSPHLNYESIERLYVHIAALPYSKYNESVVSMIKTFTESALSSKFHAMQNSQQSLEKKFFTFVQLWECLQDRDDQMVSPLIQENCFQAARHIVSNIPQTKTFLNYFFSKCFELIRDHQSVYQAISFVHYILDKQFRDDINGKRNLIKMTNDKYNIIELFVKDVEVHMEKVRAYFKDQVPTDIVIFGVQKFQQNVFFRLQMLNYLLQQSDLKITYEQVVRLYDTLCVKTKGGIQKKEFNKILLQYSGDMGPFQINRCYFPDKDTEYRFFSQILCNPKFCDYENYTPEDLDLFQMFFKQYNMLKQKLKFLGQPFQNKILVLDPNVEGKLALWEMFAKVKDLKLLDTISQLLITLHTQLSSTIAANAEKVQQEMMDKCLEFIQQSNPGLTSRSITLIVMLFNVFQSGPTTKKPFKSNAHVPFRASIITNKDSKMMEFKEGDQQTLHHWKCKLADDLGVAYKQLEVLVDNKPIENHHDAADTLLNSIIFQYSQVKVIVNKDYHPRNYLSQDSRTFNILFQLLNEQGTVEFKSQVWELVNKLPVNAEVSIRVQNCKEWNKFLDVSFYDMFYVLQIIKTCLDDVNWREQFTKSDGVDLVTQKFLGQKLEFLQCPLEKKCCLTYLDILSMPYATFDEQIRSQIQKKIIEILGQMCLEIQKRPTITVDKKHCREMYDTEAKLMKKSFELLGDGIKQFIRDPQLPRALKAFFVEHENSELKKEFQLKLSSLKGSSESQLVLRAIFSSVLDDVITERKQKSDHFFDLICDLLSNDPMLHTYKLNEEQILSFLMQSLRQLPYAEVTPKDQDHILIGVLKVLNAVLESFPQLMGKQELFKEILNYVLEESGDAKCKCKSSNSRTAAFQCLLTLLRNQHNLNIFQQEIPPLHGTPQWRTKHQGDWNIQSKFHEKSSTGFVGLQNLGCICYMNSLLQQLYMVPSFQQPIIELQEKLDQPLEENLTYQLKCLYQALKYSHKQYHNPKKFCHAFKDMDGNPTNIFEQMDVDEFCNLLMDRIEGSLKGTPDEDLVKRNFVGVMSNEIIGKTCPHYSEREEPFFAVTVPVSNKKTLEECLQTLVSGDMLEGDNAYNCEQCNKKVNALKRMCLKKLPNQLILVLKRFNFDFDLMAKAKINDRIEFPFELDLEPYSQQGLRKNENRGMDEEEYPPEYFQYKLQGVVIHIGSADSGHYYSFIKDRMDAQKWYEFNDIFVSLADQNEVIADGFGGVDKTARNTKYAPQFKDKSKSAYMLFYERVIPIVEPRKALSQKAQQMEIEQQTEVLVAPSNFMEEINDENRKFQIQRFIFSAEYFNFMEKLIKQQIEMPVVDHSIVKMLIYFFLTCAVREHDKTFITNNIVSLIALLKKSHSTSEWLLKCFSQPMYIKEFQTDCSKRMVRRYVLSLIEAAIENVQSVEGHQVIFQVQDDQPKSYVAGLINAWILMLGDIKKSLRNSADFFDLFYRFASLSVTNAQYLTSKRLIGRLLDLYMDIVLVQNPKLSKIYQDEVRKSDDVRLMGTPCNPDEYLGQQNTTSSDAASLFYDDLLEKKFEKSINFGPSTSRMYLWRTIGYLLKSSKISQLTTDEQALLNFDNIMVMNILEEGDCKLAIRMIADVLCALCVDNMKMSENVLSAIAKQVHDKEYREYRKYLVVLKRVFLIKDSLQLARINNGMVQLLNTMQKQNQYFFETDICQQYILKIVIKNPMVYQWMTKNIKIWQWILENIQNQVAPNDKLIQNNSNPSKCTHRLHNVFLPTTAQGYSKFILWKKQQYQAIYKEQPLPVQEFDSDDDLTGAHLKVDDKIDYYFSEQNCWTQATVSKVMADYVHLTFNGRMQPPNQDIEIDSERLAPLNTISCNNKIPGYQSEQQVEQMKSDHDNDTEEGNNNSDQSDSDIQ